MRRALLASLISCGVMAAGLPAVADDGVRLGETYRGVMQLKTHGEPQVPLPPGDWKMVALGESRSKDSYNTRLLTGYLIQTKGDVFVGRVIFKVPDSPTRGPWEAPSSCTRKDFIANLTTQTGANGPFDCLYIFGSGMGRNSNATAEQSAFYDYLDRQKIKKPITAFNIGFAVSDARTYLLVDYFFNPELEGVKPVGVGAWHVDHYREDPKRVAYVEAMKTWAQDWRRNIADGFKGRLTPAAIAAVPLPSLPKTVNAAPVAKLQALAKPLDQVATLGKTYRDVLPLNIQGSPQVPLPPGDWKLVVLDESENAGEKMRLVRGYLVQARGKEMVGQIYFLAPDGSSSRGWKSNVCARKDPLADLTIDAGSGQGYDCSTITSYAGTRPKSATPQLTKFHDYLEQNGIAAPPTMLNISYDISDKKTYLLVDYRFNPAAEGVRADSIAAWRPDRFSEDSKRAAYVEKMKGWAQSWHDKVAAGYKGKLPQPAALN